MPSDRGTDQAIRQVISAVIGSGINDPGTAQRLAAGQGIPTWAREMALRTTGKYVQSPERFVNAVLADFHAVLSKGS